MIQHLVRYMLGCLLLGSIGQAQIVTVTPEFPVANDTITLVFDAAAGNQALKGHKGPVYLHTGVIIGTPESPSAWRYVQGEWGTDDTRMKMTRIGPDRYQFSMHIRSFYGIAADEPFLQLGLVFRSQNGAIVAKEAGDKDIFYPQIEVLPHGPIEQADASDAQFLGDAVRVFSRRDGSLFATDGEASIVLRSFGTDILQVSYSPLPDQGSLPASAAVVIRPDIWQVAVAEAAEFVSFPIGEYTVRLQRQPLRLSVWKGDSLIVSDADGPWIDRSDPKIGTTVGIRMKLSPQERLYGTGSRALPMDRRGTRLYHYNQPSYGYTLGEDDVYLSLPVVISSKGYGLFADSYRKGYFDLGQKESDLMEWGFKDSSLQYYLILGEKPADLLAGYTRLTGRQPMPPMWALGYIQSRFGYRNQAELQSIVRRTLKAGIPMDATLLDLYWFGDKSYMGNLDWALNAWPDPKGMIQKLDSQGVETLLITETYVTEASQNFGELAEKNLLGTDTKGDPFVIPDFWAGSAGILDLTKPEAIEWMWPYYQKQLELGVAGFWCDSGEPENHPLGMRHAWGTAEEVHNVYSHLWARDLYRSFRERDSLNRWFNLIRSGYAGMQRYATFPWSGDVSRSWDAFRAQPLIMLGAGMNGIGYMHADLGGFTGGPQDPQLFQRWLQMGTFVPVMRVHGDATGFAPEPIYYDDETLEIARKAIELRYKLLPYTYTLAWENHQTGAPLARPMWFHYPEDTVCRRLDDQYLWGRDILVAPIFEKNAKQRNIYFPGGMWYDLHTGDLQVTKAGWVSIPVEKDRSPVFIRGGSMIPVLDKVPNTRAYDGTSWGWQVYVDDNLEARGKRYLDDGILVSAPQNAYQIAEAYIQRTGQKGELKMEATGPGYATLPARQQVSLQLIAPTGLIQSGKGLQKVSSPNQGAESWEGSWDWNGRTARLRLKFSAQD